VKYDLLQTRERSVKCDKREVVIRQT
jgi:hypothetical protein